MGGEIARGAVGVGAFLVLPDGFRRACISPLPGDWGVPCGDELGAAAIQRGSPPAGASVDEFFRRGVFCDTRDTNRSGRCGGSDRRGACAFHLCPDRETADVSRDSGAFGIRQEDGVPDRDNARADQRVLVYPCWVGDEQGADRWGDTSGFRAGGGCDDRRFLLHDHPEPRAVCVGAEDGFFAIQVSRWKAGNNGADRPRR